MFGRGWARQDAGMPNDRRVWVPGGTYFFTVNLLDRRQRLLVEHVDALRDAFGQTRAQRPFEILAIVILPDHLHCLWRLPAGDADNATRWRSIKTRFSRALPTGERRCARRRMKGERGIWQRRYWEHLIGDDHDLQAHVDDIHINPVKHGQTWSCCSRGGLDALVLSSRRGPRRAAAGLGGAGTCAPGNPVGRVSTRRFWPAGTPSIQACGWRMHGDGGSRPAAFDPPGRRRFMHVRGRMHGNGGSRPALRARAACHGHGMAFAVTFWPFPWEAA
jgi:putative transposase